MNTVTIGVASLVDSQRRASAAFRGKKQGARISFASEDLLWKTLRRGWAKREKASRVIRFTASGERHFRDLVDAI